MNNIILQEQKDWDNNLEFYIQEEKSVFKKILNKKALAFFQIKSGKILDIGCATGHFLSLLPKKVKKTGIDFSHQLITYAKVKRPQIRFSIGSAEKLPFKDNYFDGVIFKGVLHHLKVENILNQGLKEADRVLKPGGIIYIHDRHHSFIGRLIHRLAIILRHWLKPYFRHQSTSASDHEPEFGFEDLVWLDKHNYQLIGTEFTLSAGFFILVCTCNLIQYFFGVKIADKIRRRLLFLAEFMERFLAIDQLSVEFLLKYKKYEKKH